MQHKRTSARKIIAILSFLSFINVHAQTYVLFDLGNVLIDVNSQAALAQMGKKNIAHFAVSHLSKIFTFKKYLHNRFMKFLHAVEQSQEPLRACDPMGQLIPPIMCRYFKGADSREMRSIIEEFSNTYQFLNLAEKNIIRSMSTMFFTPERFITTQQLNPAGERCVRECIARGALPCIHSTWDKESFELLKQKYPEFFALFQDRIFISGTTGLMKPDQKSFIHILQVLHADPSDCVFIDDRIENILSAQRCGIYSILASQKKYWLKTTADFTAIGQQLDAWFAEKKAKQPIVVCGTVCNV